MLDWIVNTFVGRMILFAFAGLILALLKVILSTIFKGSDRKKNEKKLLIIGGAVILVFIGAIIGVNISGGNAGESEVVDEPLYASAQDIQVQLDSSGYTYELVETATDLMFEYEDENGEIIDWSDEEKQQFWDASVETSDQFKTVAYQEFESSDVMSIHTMPEDNAAYTNIDDFIDGYVSTMGYKYTRNDFTIGDVHACTIYLDTLDNESDKDESCTIFYYKDYVYLISVIPMLGDVEENTEMFIDTIILK